jgi:hypothetical protein
MKLSTKIKLAEAWKYCDIEDKSTEFMLEYMQDVANVDLDCVISFLQKHDTWDEILQS